MASQPVLTPGCSHMLLREKYWCVFGSPKRGHRRAGGVILGAETFSTHYVATCPY